VVRWSFPEARVYPQRCIPFFFFFTATAAVIHAELKGALSLGRDPKGRGGSSMILIQAHHTFMIDFVDIT